MNAAQILQSTDSQLAQPLSFSVPIGDLTAFAALTEPRRTEVQVYLKLLERVHALRGPEASLQRALLTVSSTSKHLMRGCSPMSLRRKYEAFLAVDENGKQIGWRALVANYKAPSSQPAEFKQYVKRLAEENHRSMAQAFQLIHEQWREGHPIPGYGTWVEYHIRLYPDRPVPKTCPRTLLPTGWSISNLRNMAPNKGARMLALRGISAAKKFFPSIKRDPSGLRPLELIVIDDFELDCLCVFPGDATHKPQIGRVAGLLAMDVATRRKLHWGIGQRLERTEEQPDGTIKTIRTGITRVDVQVLLHGLFGKYGMPEYTITILCENAAAAISPELELALSTLFEGRVRVERTGLIDHKTLANGFVERGGKPWEKGWIESAFNLLWNKMGSMPGYKGSNQRLNAPGDLDAKIACTKLLLGQGERGLNLPPEKIMLLRLPFPSPQVVEHWFGWACSAVDANSDHRYVGFERVTEFLLEEGSEPQPFHALALLPPDVQLQVQTIDRPESSFERWGRLMENVNLRPIPQAVLALMLLTPKKVTYRNHAVTFVHDKAGYSYVDEHGTVLREVQDGTEFLGYVDLKAPEQLHVATLKGAYVGTLNRLGGRRGMIDIRDKAALKDAAAVQATIINRTVAEVRERHAEADAQLAQDRAHNEAIKEQHKIETAGLTTAEKICAAAGENAAVQHERKALERRVQSRAGKITANDIDDFIGGDAPVAATTQPNVAPSPESLSDYM